MNKDLHDILRCAFISCAIVLTSCIIDESVSELNIPPISRFEFTEVNDSTYLFKNESVNANEFEWDFGGPGAVQGPSLGDDVLFKYSSPGSYTVKLVAIRGLLRDSTTNLIEQPLIVDFEAVLDDNFNVNFENKSRFTDSYLWEIDGKVFNDIHPSYQFERDLEYTIKLTGFLGQRKEEVSKALKISFLESWKEVEQPTPFTPRRNHDVFHYDDKVWLIGGEDGDASIMKDVWNSSDCRNWNLLTSNANFPTRQGYSIQVFNEKIWLIGGNDIESNLFNDIWSTTDGKNWILEKENAAFSPRTGHQMIVWNNIFWLVGGAISESPHYLDDVWNSSDGVNWTEVTASGGFSARFKHELINFEEEIWVIGGRDGNSSTLDVYRSQDLMSWVSLNTQEFGSIFGHGVVAYYDSIWVVGGWKDGLITSSYWTSIDGSHWIEKMNSGIPNLYAHSTLVHEGDIWIFGGYNRTPSPAININNVWKIGWEVSLINI